MDKASAATRLGIPDNEVLDVFDEDAGLIVKTFDGQSYIIVPDDQPDGERTPAHPAGKTGLMFLAAPSVTYGGAFPVYVRPADELDDDDEDAERDAGDVAVPAGDDPAPVRHTEHAHAPAKKAPAAKKAAGRKATA